jgi:hypothetical protein
MVIGHIGQSHASFPPLSCISQGLPHINCMVIGHIGQSHASFPHHNCISQALPHLYCMVTLASSMLPFFLIIASPPHILAAWSLVIGHIGQSHASFPPHNCISQALPHLYCMVRLVFPMHPIVLIIVFHKPSHIFAWSYWTVPCFLSSS